MEVKENRSHVANNNGNTHDLMVCIEVEEVGVVEDVHRLAKEKNIEL